jgi:hypothetical protein
MFFLDLYRAFQGLCALPKELGQEDFIHVTPAPIFTRFKRLYYGVFGLVEVLGSVLILRRIAATDVAANQTQAQMYPRITHLKAFLAAFACRCDFLYLFCVGAGMLRHFFLLCASDCRDHYLRHRNVFYSPCSSMNFSTSIAAMQPLPAAVMAWR